MLYPEISPDKIRLQDSTQRKKHIKKNSVKENCKIDNSLVSLINEYIPK